MSNRTIVEFNHDFAHIIYGDPDGFFQLIRQMLHSGVNGNPDNERGVKLETDLARFGITTTPTHHHSEQTRLMIGRHFDKRL